jgi:hypothetical protein
MPTMNNYFNFIYVNLGFLAQITVMMYFKSIVEIKENWPLYRCNPPYWIFSDNIAEDFTYCVQNTQINFMSYLLQPLNYMITALSSIGLDFTGALDAVRNMFAFIREAVTKIIENIFGVFLNIVVELQKMTVSIKDMVGKMVGIVTTIMYVLDGSIKTMNSAWSGPPGQLVKAIGSVGSCFHPETKVRLKNGEIYSMKDLPLGAELEDGARVFSVMKIANLHKSPLYKMNDGVNGENIYVTGEHFIFDTNAKNWIQIKDCKYAYKQEEVISDWYSCLITTNRQIVIGKHQFWDWEDDELTNKMSNI